MSSKGAKKEETKPQVAKTATATGAEGSLMDDLTKKQAFKKFSYRGEDLTKLLNMNIDDLS
jgi:hypothetical protein